MHSLYKDTIESAFKNLADRCLSVLSPAVRSAWHTFSKFSQAITLVHLPYKITTEMTFQKSACRAWTPPSASDERSSGNTNPADPTPVHTRACTLPPRATVVSLPKHRIGVLKVTVMNSASLVTYGKVIWSFTETCYHIHTYIHTYIHAYIR